MIQDLELQKNSAAISVVQLFAIQYAVNLNSFNEVVIQSTI